MSSHQRTFWPFLALCVVSAACLFPLAWILLTSLKTLSETYVIPPTWIPRRPTLGNYAYIWGIQSFWRLVLNSIVVAGAATLLSLTVAGLAGYGFSRFRFRGKRTLMIFALATQMFPGIVLVIPYFGIASAVGLFNTRTALVIAYVSFVLPFAIWMLKGVFDAVPHEIDEASLIDGTSWLGALLRVVLPASLPGIAATGLYCFLVAWNEYLFAVVLTSTPDMQVVSVGVASMIGQFRVQWNNMMAGAVLASIPTVFVFAFLERFFVSGLSGGAVKG